MHRDQRLRRPAQRALFPPLHVSGAVLLAFARIIYSSQGLPLNSLRRRAAHRLACPHRHARLLRRGAAGSDGYLASF